MDADDELRLRLLAGPCVHRPQGGEPVECGASACCLDPVECWRQALDTADKPCDTTYVEPGQPNTK